MRADHPVRAAASPTVVPSIRPYLNTVVSRLATAEAGGLLGDGERTVALDRLVDVPRDLGEALFGDVAARTQERDQRLCLGHCERIRVALQLELDEERRELVRHGVDREPLPRRPDPFAEFELERAE